MLKFFIFFSILILIKANDFENFCQKLNQNGSVCSYSCDSQFNLSVYNLTNIQIILNDHSLLGNTSLQNITISSLTLRQNQIDLNRLTEISAANFINLLVFNNIVNLDNILSNNKSINLLKNKVYSVHLIPIINTIESSIANYIKTFDGLGIKSVKISNVRVSALNLDLRICYNIIELSFFNCEFKNFKLTLNWNLKKIVLSILGMENFTIQLKNESNIEKISIDKSQLSFVYFPVLKNLKFLSINRNRWKKIDRSTFANLTNLEELGIRSNMISQIESDSFFVLKKLNNLNLADNLLNENIKINGPNSLQILDLSNNNFSKFSSKLNLNNTPMLRRLILARNKLEYIFIDLPVLDSLELGFNKLKIIDFIFGSKIDLSSNEIMVSKLKLNNIPRIDSVLLVSNSIKDLTPNDLLTFQNTSLINLSNNQLRDIQFPFLNKLKFLILVNNSLTIIENNYFSNLTELFELNLFNNQISILRLNCFQHNTKLKILNLGNNAIKTIPNLSFFVNLDNLILENQNSSFFMEKNSFENFNKNNSQLEISIKNNQNFNINSQAFCSKNFKNIKINFDRINLYPKCIFRQMIERNASLEINGQYDCEFKTMFALYKIPANFLYKTCLNNIQQAEDCSQEVNLKYRCSYDISSLEHQVYHILLNNTCQANGITYCIRSQYFNLICYFITDINGNQSISKVILEIFDRQIQVIEFSSGSMFIYQNLESVFLIVKNHSSYFIFMKATRHYYEKLRNNSLENNEVCVQKFTIYLKENYLKKFKFDNKINLNQIAIDLKKEIFQNQSFFISLKNSASKIHLKFFTPNTLILKNFYFFLFLYFKFPIFK